MQRGRYAMRRIAPAGITVVDIDMVLTYGGRTYRLMTRSDDCMHLVLISDDYEVIESGCVENADLGTVMKFLRNALLR